MHSHPASVVVYVTDGKTRMTTRGGKSEETSGKSGTANWAPAGGHLPQNVGEKRFEAVLVELKK